LTISLVGELGTAWLISDTAVIVDLEGKFSHPVRKGRSITWNITPGRRRIGIAPHYPAPPLTVVTDLTPGRAQSIIITVNERWPRGKFAREFQTGLELIGPFSLLVMFFSNLPHSVAGMCVRLWSEIVCLFDLPQTAIRISSLFWSSHVIPVYIMIGASLVYYHIRKVVLGRLFVRFVKQFGSPFTATTGENETKLTGCTTANFDHCRRLACNALQPLPVCRGLRQPDRDGNARR
jgi:hypothetical protein